MNIYRNETIISSVDSKRMDFNLTLLGKGCTSLYTILLFRPCPLTLPPRHEGARNKVFPSNRYNLNSHVILFLDFARLIASR